MDSHHYQFTQLVADRPYTVNEGMYLRIGAQGSEGQVVYTDIITKIVV